MPSLRKRNTVTKLMQGWERRSEMEAKDKERRTRQIEAISKLRHIKETEGRTFCVNPCNISR